MTVLKQFGILLAFWLLGEWTAKLIQGLIVIPGAIMGMLLLFIALTTGLIKEDTIKTVSDWLLSNIAFFFVPASVGLIATSGLKIAPLLLLGVISTFVTLVVTALVTHLLTSKHKEV